MVRKPGTSALLVAQLGQPVPSPARHRRARPVSRKARAASYFSSSSVQHWRGVMLTFV